MKRGVIVQGMDISLNHGAVVQLRDGELDDFWYYTNIAGAAARSKEHGFRIEMPTPTKEPDKQIREAIRLAWVSKWMDRVALARRPDFAGLEDYAIGADQGAHYIGQVGGQARLLLWLRGVRFRLHDPIAMKMFVAHDATAQKDLIERCVLERWGADFSEFNAKQGKSKKKPARTTSEDLADAFGMAKIVWSEYLLRRGKLKLNELHEEEIRVFNRATKAFPVNILGREWIHNPSGVFSSPRFETCTGGRCSLHVLGKRGVLSDRAKASIGKIMEGDSGR